ncbi:hypothetical protein HX856_07145 [Marine Group I thaumarchaeote]|nr:hypothetical protein [Marine Group I thaumarchaeote]
MNDKEKLRHQLIMAKSLVKSNNKKIKNALEEIDKMTEVSSKAEDSCAVDRMIILRKIREILEK